MSTTDISSRSGAGLLTRFLSPYRVLRGNRSLELLLGGQTLSTMGNMLYSVALVVLAYDLTRSATVVSLLAFARLLPYALLTPLVGILADRWNRTHLMMTADLGRTACMLGLMLVHSKGTLWIAFPLVMISAALSTPYRAALYAIPPTLVSGEELVDANALMSQMVNVSTVVGPALGGLLVVLGSPQTAFLINALTFLVSAMTLYFVHLPVQPAPTHAEEESWLTRILAGFHFLFRENESTLIAPVAMSAAVGFLGGAFWPVTIVLAEKSFGLGGQGTGYLNAAYGAGGIIAGLVTGILTARFHVGRTFMTAVAATYILFALYGQSWTGLIALGVLVIYGFADVLGEVASTTIIQSATPNEILGRVLTASDSLLMATALAGTLLAGPTIGWVGARVTTIAYTAVALSVFLLLLPRLLRMQSALDIRTLLRAVPIFSVLPYRLLDQLPPHLQLERYPAGAVIVRQGERGDRLYIVKSGKVEVIVTDAENREVILATIDRADYFGEIALLRDVPRTATVRSCEPTELYDLNRDEFDALLRASGEFAQGVGATSTARYGRVQQIMLHA